MNRIDNTTRLGYYLYSGDEWELPVARAHMVDAVLTSCTEDEDGEYMTHCQLQRPGKQRIHTTDYKQQEERPICSSITAWNRPTKNCHHQSKVTDLSPVNNYQVRETDRENNIRSRENITLSSVADIASLHVETMVHLNQAPSSDSGITESESDVFSMNSLCQQSPISCCNQLSPRMMSPDVCLAIPETLQFERQGKVVSELTDLSGVLLTNSVTLSDIDSPQMLKPSLVKEMSCQRPMDRVSKWCQGNARMSELHRGSTPTNSPKSILKSKRTLRKNIGMADLSFEGVNRSIDRLNRSLISPSHDSHVTAELPAVCVCNKCMRERSDLQTSIQNDYYSTSLWNNNYHKSGEGLRTCHDESMIVADRDTGNTSCRSYGSDGISIHSSPHAMTSPCHNEHGSYGTMHDQEKQHNSFSNHDARQHVSFHDNSHDTHMYNRSHDTRNISCYDRCQCYLCHDKPEATADHSHHRLSSTPSSPSKYITKSPDTVPYSAKCKNISPSTCISPGVPSHDNSTNHDNTSLLACTKRLFPTDSKPISPAMTPERPTPKPRTSIRRKGSLKQEHNKTSSNIKTSPKSKHHSFSMQQDTGQDKKETRKTDVHKVVPGDICTSNGPQSIKNIRVTGGSQSTTPPSYTQHMLMLSSRKLPEVDLSDLTSDDVDSDSNNTDRVKRDAAHHKVNGAEWDAMKSGDHCRQPSILFEKKVHFNDTAVEITETSWQHYEDDLAQLSAPYLEESIIKTLEARYKAGLFYTKLGGTVVFVNPSNRLVSPKALQCAKPPDSKVQNVVDSAIQQQLENNYSQVIVLSGESGSGKSYTTNEALYHLFNKIGGGSGTDCYKHLASTLTVLRSLGQGQTLVNSDSSRVGYFVETQVTDGLIHKTRVHTYSIDMARVCDPQQGNYHIFYEMLAGLTVEEKVKLHLEGCSYQSLSYLQSEQERDQQRDHDRFLAWKNALGILGIPFSDIMRLLATIMLLGNISFVDGDGLELNVERDHEMKSVAALLGISSISLYKGLATRVKTVKTQTIKTHCTVQAANKNRDSLAKALYCRTFHAIMRRANSMKKHHNLDTTLNESCNDSFNQSFQHWHQHTSHSKKSNHKTRAESIIGVLDMMGFENTQVNTFEQLCINLWAETVQHFYNMHTFKACLEAYKDDGLEADVSFVDNSPIIELVSLQSSGLISILDGESINPKGTAENFLQKIKSKHKDNKHLLLSEKASHFKVKHYCDVVEYCVTDMVTANRDEIPDDIITMFSKQTCNFGFLSHLFTVELRQLRDSQRGEKYRVSPKFSTNTDHSDHKGTLSMDFQNKMDGLLKILVHTKPHFVLCIKPSDEPGGIFSREAIYRQVKGLQLKNTVNIVAGGFPHRMHYKAFNNKYQFLIQGKKNLTENKKKSKDNHYAVCKLILEHFLKILDESDQPYTSATWALGSKHIFLSETACQQLENLREERQHKAAIVFQASWKRWICQRKWPALRRQLELRKHQRSLHNTTVKYRSKPLALMNSFESTIHHKNIDDQLKSAIKSSYISTTRESCSSSQYNKDFLPHMRSMTANYSCGGVKLCQGQSVLVIGLSIIENYVLVESNGQVIDVPYQITVIRSKQEVSTGLWGTDV